MSIQQIDQSLHVTLLVKIIKLIFFHHKLQFNHFKQKNFLFMFYITQTTESAKCQWTLCRHFDLLQITRYFTNLKKNRNRMLHLLARKLQIRKYAKLVSSLQTPTRFKTNETCNIQIWLSLRGFETVLRKFAKCN